MRKLQNVLVTGATGFIGQRLLARLRDEPCLVRALVLKGDAEEGAARQMNAEVVYGSVDDESAVEQAVKGVDTVFHLAAAVGDWLDPDIVRKVTIEGTRTVLKAAAREGARCVLASSIVVYGDALGRDVCAEDHPFGRSVGMYSESKQEQERIADELAAKENVSVVKLRLANVFGPNSRPWVQMVLEQLRTGAPTLIGGGGQNAGLCHVDNAAHAFVCAAKHEAAQGQSYNIHDGSDITWRRYFSDLARAGGCRAPRSLPALLAPPLALACEALWSKLRLKGRPPVTREAVNIVGSNHRIPIGKARRELGYEARVDYERGIEEIERSLR